MATNPPKLLTPGRIAEELGATLPEIQHVLRTNPSIRPVALAGTLRIYRRADLETIATALQARKAAAHAD